MSTMGKNMIHLTGKYDISINNIKSMSKTHINRYCYTKWRIGINDEYPIYAGIVREMIMMKEERCIRTLSNDDCNFVINFLCTI